MIYIYKLQQEELSHLYEYITNTNYNHNPHYSIFSTQESLSSPSTKTALTSRWSRLGKGVSQDHLNHSCHLQSDTHFLHNQKIEVR